MEYDKMLFYPNATQMSATACLNTQSHFKIGEAETNRFAQSSADPFVTFADSFDLSLLPQDIATFNETNIPTTVYQYNDNANNNQHNSENTNSTTPTIKIEESWSKVAETTTSANDIKEEQSYSLLYEELSRNQIKTATNQLVPPPPAYPNIYPSPQSSPSQSEYNFSYTSNSSYYDSLSSARASLYSTSPCPSLDAASIKQELHILPPSPPESNCEVPSPRSSCADIKSEPLESDVETTFIDLNTLLEKKQQDRQQQQEIQQQIPQENQLLRECLEDTSFQKKHNLKPLALASFIDGLEAESEDFEPVISLALQHVKREADAVCAKLQISQDPTAWSTLQVHAWLRSTILQFKLPQIENLETKFNENGAALTLLSEEEFTHRAPESGSILHAQLEIWKLAYSNDYKQSTMLPQTYASSTNNPQQVQQTPWNIESMTNMSMDVDEDTDDGHNLTAMTAKTTTQTTKATPTISTEMPTEATATNVTNNNPTAKRAGMPTQRTGGSHIHLWQFLKELLQAPHINGTAIRWIDRSKGIFKIEDSVRVAKLWGKRKNRPAMNYDKLSRSIRQYYKKGIMKKTERSQRLVYQFCHPYYL